MSSVSQSKIWLNALTALRANMTSMTADSRNVQIGSLFLAYPGEAIDGRNYISHAIAKGAAAVMWEQSDFTWQADLHTPNIGIANLRQFAGNIAHEFYDRPSNNLWMVGITGTNGKTSCSHWMAQAFNFIGRKSAVIGTLGNGLIPTLTPTINTTPDTILLHGMLADYLKQGADTVSMEVSSHGLDQGRVNGINFDIAVFTNLSRDHLDYHGDMESYALAKQKLFDWPDLHCAVLNSDDVVGAEFAAVLAKRCKNMLTYGFKAADIQGHHLSLTEDGLSMRVTTPKGEVNLKASVLGRFNAYNVLAVFSSLIASDVPLDKAAEAIAQIQPVLGRMEKYGGKNAPVIVIDYAHTPDALEKTLSTLREQTQGKLMCVFGCGGNRDQGKRPLMGKVVSELADFAIVTSDNPRNEDPQAIINAVLTGMTGNHHEVYIDRAQAIQQAIQQASKGDVILVAGKGHEDYQEIAGVKYAFSDAAVVKAELIKNELAKTELGTLL